MLILLGMDIYYWIINAIGLSVSTIHQCLRSYLAVLFLNIQRRWCKYTSYSKFKCIWESHHLSHLIPPPSLSPRTVSVTPRSVMMRNTCAGFIRCYKLININVVLRWHVSKQVIIWTKPKSSYPPAYGRDFVQILWQLNSSGSNSIQLNNKTTSFDSRII